MTLKETKIEINVDDLEMTPNSLLVYQPRFTDTDRKTIKALVRKLDGQITEMTGDRDDTDSALIRDIFLQYTEAEIEMHTFRESCLLEKLRLNQLRAEEDRKLADQKERTFQAKAEALQIPIIKEHSDKEVIRKIRRASSPTEVAALVALEMIRTKM